MKGHMATLPWNEIAGAIVAIPFTLADGRRLAGGTHLTADEVKALGNHRVLIRNEYIKVYPPHGETAHVSEARHVVHCGGGNFDVIAGRKLNDKPLTKDEAHALARSGVN